LLRKGEMNRALTDFEEALRRMPGHLRAVALRGQVRLRQGRYEEAIQDFDRTVAIEPSLLLRSLALQSHGDVKGARVDLERVAREQPEHVRGQFARAVLSLKDEKHVEAVAESSRAVDDPALGPFAL